MRILLLAEKPSLARLVADPVLTKHRGQDGHSSITTVCCLPYTTLDARFDIAPPWLMPMRKPNDGTFRYPHDITWSQVPVVMTPRYRDVSTDDNAIGLLWWDGLPHGPSETVPSSDVRVRSGTWDVVYGIFDPDSTGVHGFEMALQIFFGAGPRPDVRWLPLCDFSSSSVEIALRTPNTWGDVRERGVSHSLVKRHFVYNYAINAHVVLGKALREATGLAGGSAEFMRTVASRTALQCLYMMRDVGEVTDGQAIGLMQDWKGSGRYAVTREPYSSVFGSGPSQGTTIERLVAMGLLVRDGRLLRMAARGERYLSILHPDCQDPDQDLRLALWRTLPLDEGISKVDRYVRTFFGKQKRFVRG